MPWGVSESACNARDLEMTYHYSSFCAPGWGLKRGLAAMVDLQGAQSRFDFYEALDFTTTRPPTAIERSCVAHHQGMTITALTNLLYHGNLRARFHAKPMIQPVELLLQERVPRDAAVVAPRATDVQISPVEHSDTPSLRRVQPLARFGGGRMAR